MAVRRQWSLAIGLSGVAHVLVFVFMIASMEPTLPPPQEEAIQVFLDRPMPPEPPEPPEPRVEEVARAPAPRPEPAPATRPVPAQSSPPPVSTRPLPALRAGAFGNGQTPSRSTGQVAGPVITPGGKPSCLGKYVDKMQGKDRIDCEQEIYAFIDRKASDPLTLALDPAKQAAYDAAAARKAYRRSPVSRLGGGAQTGCVDANKGAGCLDDMTIPVTGAAGRNFRQGERTPRTQ